jgi:hypothetical protein
LKKKGKNQRKGKGTKKIKKFEFKKKTENDLTRRYFLAVGLAYADGKS